MQRKIHVGDDGTITIEILLNESEGVLAVSTQVSASDKEKDNKDMKDII